MTKVWIATSGSYSDYRINAVFLDEEEGSKYVERHNRIHDGQYGESMILEEWETSDGEAEEEWEGYFTVFLMPRWGPGPWADGFTHDLVVHTHDDVDDREPMMEIFFEDSREGEYPVMRIPYSTAKEDPEVAKKIFTDRLAQYAAEQEGLT